MPRAPHPYGSARKEPVLDHVLQMSIDRTDGEFDPETGRYGEVVLNGLDGAAHATEIRRAMYRSARHLKVSLDAKPEKSADGSHAIRFTVIDKEAGKRYINSRPAHTRAYNQHIEEV